MGAFEVARVSVGQDSPDKIRIRNICLAGPEFRQTKPELPEIAEPPTSILFSLVTCTAEDSLPESAPSDIG